jgi:hypothetical protein
LRQDQHAGDELDLPGEPGEVTKQNQRLMEWISVALGRPPTRAAGGIGADDMIVGQQVMKAQFFGRLGVVFDGTRIVADFGLWENHSDMHFAGSLPSANRAVSTVFAAGGLLISATFIRTLSLITGRVSLTGAL